MFAKPGLDEAPARGELGIAFRDRPDAVQVPGQYDGGIDLEWGLLPAASEGGTQDINIRTLGNKRTALCGDSGNRVAPAWDVGALVLHGGFAFVGLRCANPTYELTNITAAIASSRVAAAARLTRAPWMSRKKATPCWSYADVCTERKKGLGRNRTYPTRVEVTSV